jgi:hypothetical protein
MLNRPEDNASTPKTPIIRYYPHEMRRFTILGVLIVVNLIVLFLLLAGGLQDTLLRMFIG